MGKTTLLRSVLAEVTGVQHVVGSAVLRQLAGEEFDRFDHLPPARKHEYRVAAIEFMADLQRDRQEHLLCDGHTALLDESTGEVGGVFTDSDCRFFKELILMEAPADVVLDRRRGDASKRRSLDPAVVRLEVEAERAMATKVAARWGMKLHRLPLDPAAATVALKEVLSC